MYIQKELESVINQRYGSVLGKNTILKSDHFPGCQNKKLMPQIDGAPNYRQAGSLHVHGVAIPTLEGIKNVLNHIGAQKDGNNKKVLWHNLREEPVVYINGRPFVLRDIEKPFSNVEYTGINRERVEEMEGRLKEDVLQEASRYGNKILVTDELPDGQMVDQWDFVNRDSVKTPLEVYEELQAEGYLVDYERVPITDEKSPKECDFDNLVRRISKEDLTTEIVFNCQMGRGRTTTGMVIATLIFLNRTGASDMPRNYSLGRILDGGVDISDDTISSEEAILRGEYTVIRSLVRVLEGGVEGKRQVDKVIDKCASMQNLREAIATYRNNILCHRDEMKRETLLSFFVEYLERYYFLICFAVYIHTERAALLPQQSSREVSFADWMKARPELYSILRRLLRRDPMGALGYSTSKPPQRVCDSDGKHPSEMGIVPSKRTGEVLGRQTVLKSDHCPGCQNLKLPERVEGAPNFREVPGFPVYGVANPTIDGIRAVIQRISTMRNCPIFWHNMREEPVVYINGRPFVLREAERPYKNMLEYTGIERQRVENMEARLKEDVLKEAKKYGGAIMVTHETEDGQIFDAWESVNPEVVKTPLEVYKHLEAEGLPVKYARVPITDGKAPKSADFDTMAINIASASPNTAFVFNCQMGQGRTTTGTVIACLVKLRIDNGRPIRFPLDDLSIEKDNSGTSSGSEATGARKFETSSECVEVKSGREFQHTFGINDILLLRKVTRLFDNAIECRMVLDAVIDRCSAMQNIRQAVLQYWKVFNQQNVEPRERRVALNRGAEYLERYFRLIAFSAYLGSEAFDSFCGQGETRISFKTWIHRRPEAQSMKWNIRLRPGRFFTVPVELRTPHESHHGDAVMEAIVNSRFGSVLGKGSILKTYFFPGQRTSSHIQIPGAPHVFKVDGFPVYSMATPTLSGAMEMLKTLGAKPEKFGKVGQKVLLIDLREEAVVYINGTPFVLREFDQAVSTMKLVGITGPMVEHMEARMKEDIFAEVMKSGGRMLLHREESSPASDHSSVIGFWENVLLDDVKTPAEVYASLQEEGYNVEYRRVPLTSEREATANDVDAVQSCTDESVDYYLFVSHTGLGCVAYAMAITCLRLQADFLSTPPRSPTSDVRDARLSLQDGILSSPLDAQEVFKQGDYRDILKLTRVLMHGPQSKAEVDAIIDSCAGAGNLRTDILYYKTELEKSSADDDEHKTYLMDMGIKALRRYVFLITFRSYLFSKLTKSDTSFTSWMAARPELGHLCHNVKFDK